MRGIFPLFVLGDGFPPVQIEAGHKGVTVGQVVRVEAQAEEHGLDAGKPAAEVLGGGKGQAENEVAIVIFLTLCEKLRRLRRIGFEREILVEERLHMSGYFGGGFIAERACLKLREN